MKQFTTLLSLASTIGALLATSGTVVAQTAPSGSGSSTAERPDASPGTPSGDASPAPAPEPAVAQPSLPPATSDEPPAPRLRAPVIRLDDITAVGTRESRTAGSVHILKTKDLERLNLDNPEQVVKQVPGVYTRGEDGFGLRPNIGVRGTSPDRSKKITLMEDGVLFGPAPYSAPAAYYFPLITRMEAVRVIKGPGAIVFGPQTVGGALDLGTRSIPVGGEGGGLDLALGQYQYGKLHAFYGTGTQRTGYVIEGVHLRTDGYKQMDGGGDTGFSRNEWMWKGRHALSTEPGARHELGLKLGYSDEDSDETYLGLTDADFRRTPNRRYRASRLDHMNWHRTQVAATYHAELGQSLTLDAVAYRHDLDRSWRKLNRLGTGAPPIADVLADPTGVNALYYGVLTGELDSSGGRDTLYIGPNHRTFVAQGVQGRLVWRGDTGPIVHRAELGARYHYDRINRLHTEEPFFMRGGRLVATGGRTLTTSDQRAWAHAVALHAMDAITWRALTLTPGVRVEMISTRVRDRLSGDERSGDPQRVVIPGIGSYLALTSSLGLLAGAYSGFSPAAPGLSSAVKPERSVNYEGGLRFSARRFRLEGIGFFNDYANLTSVCTVALCGPGQVDVQYNAGRAHIYGAETFASGQVNVGRGLTLPFMGAYTYTRTRLRDSFTSEDPTLGDVTAGDELPYVPRHQAAASVGLDSERAGITVGGTYTSSTRERAGGGAIPAQLRTDSALLVDVNLRLRVHVRGDVYLSVRNALGEDALAARRPFGARPVGPRWLMLGTRWNF